jgi:hypothetical protein
LLVLAVVLGCTDRPHAPALSNDAVFQSDREGLRFPVPDGWVQFERSELPPGPVSQPRLLVSYHPAKPDTAAELELYRVDLPEDADPGQFLADHPIGALKWSPKPPPQPLELNGAPATRYTFTRGTGRTEVTREVVAFRRGPRVYLFAVTFPASDPEARDQLRRAVQNVIWKK